MNMKYARILLILALGAVGCAAPIAGTWQASGPAGPEHPIAAVTFCHDGTFTASADYGGGKTHAMTGCYCVKGEKLMLCMKDSKREYGVKVDGCCLNITHEGKTQKLCRVKSCCPMGGCAKCCEKASCPAPAETK